MDTVRLWRVALLLVLVVLGGNARGQAQETTLIVQSSPLAGFRYHAAASVWEELRVGDRLELARERDNPHDANAVSVSWRGRKLGYVPRHENAALAWGLDRGAQLAARISRLAPGASPSRRLEFEVYAE
jgi:hypothetical protein